MIELKHTVNLVTEIDENKMPSHFLTMLVNMSESDLHSMLANTFMSALNELGVLNKLNENNQYATLKWGDN
jgi:hypothetical protein